MGEEFFRLRDRVRDLETENAKLKKQLSEAIQPVVVPVIPVTDFVMISRNDYIAEMRKVGIEPISLGTPLDAQLSLTSKAELDRIAPELVYPAEWYIEGIWDCENYGLEAMNDSARLFHVNGITLCLGNMPLGYHGFAITMGKDMNVYWLEPNAGFLYAGVWHKIGAQGYKPNKVFV